MKTLSILTNTIGLLIIVSLIILSCEKEPEPPVGKSSFQTGTVPVVSVQAAQSLTFTGAEVNVQVTSTGNRVIKRLCLCYSTVKSSPDTLDQVVELGEVAIAGTYKATLSNLTHNIKYYYRAYSRNRIGNSYSTALNFTTPKDTRLPEVTTGSASSITLNTATLSGTITSFGQGATSVSQYGHVWSKNSTPTLSDNKTQLGSTSSTSITSNLTGLTESTIYYYRAYATNSTGTSYGGVQNFTTYGVPTVTTNDVTSITAATATSGGSVTATGGSSVTARGVCWSTNQNPTVSDSKTTNGTGNGSYTSSITGLNPLTTYYVKAYATNQFGTGYGDQKILTTLKADWLRKTDFQGLARHGAVGFAIGTKGYIGTGWLTGGTFAKDFWEYDPITNIWTQKADFGGIARHSAVSFSIGIKGYIGTGGDGSTVQKDFWEYNPSNNTWTKKADFGGTARREAVGFSIGTKGYIGTGGNKTKDFWEYDPTTNIWTQKADFGGTGRFYAVGFSIENKGYIGTGYDGGVKEDFWEYNPSTNNWSQKAGFGGGVRSGAVGFAIGTKGYIGTGYNADKKCKDFWEYDPTTNAWTQKVEFVGDARAYALGFSIGIIGYFGTGNSTGQLKDFWSFYP
ncbi:MAG: hypothetical protein AB9846_09515 [Tenuifilaceae bacterium]